MAWLRTQAARLDAAVAGSVAVQAPGEGARNRFYFVMPQGEVTFYDERHLFRMAGEQAYPRPSEWWCPGVAGALRCKSATTSLSRFMRNRGDYDALLLVANWPAPRQEQWRALLPARAIENQCWLAAVNIVGEDEDWKAYRGGSTVIDCSQRHGGFWKAPECSWAPFPRPSWQPSGRPFRRLRTRTTLNWGAPGSCLEPKILRGFHELRLELGSGPGRATAGHAP